MSFLTELGEVVIKSEKTLLVSLEVRKIFGNGEAKSCLAELDVLLTKCEKANLKLAIISGDWKDLQMGENPLALVSLGASLYQSGRVVAISAYTSGGFVTGFLLNIIYMLYRIESFISETYSEALEKLSNQGDTIKGV